MISAEELKQLIAKNSINNCALINGEYKSVGTYNVTKNIEFEKEIAKKYDKHVAVTSLLGCRTTFDYAIEGKEVKITRCKGTNGKVIIPKFVTAIIGQALYKNSIKELTLNEGLKAIRSRAFSNNNISELVIPKTVQYIGRNAFSDNKGLVDSTGKYTNKLKIRNKKALIIDACK